MENYVSISKFYVGRSVFITGGTGFLGMVLIEKLLRSCPDIKNVYILIRSTRNQNIITRLNDLLASEIFDTIRRENPENLKKVVPINGDITSENLGLSESDQDILCQTVSVVFHSAATTKFHEKLKLAVQINMLGTRKVIELCQKMCCLEALVHISTAYSNCDRADVSEFIYPPPFNPDDIISLVERMPEKILDELTPTLVGKRPNTYTFTKALTESMILKEASNLPVVIVRPSAVLSTWCEPIPGWLGNTAGPTGSVVGLGMGLFRAILGDSSKKFDIIPADIVANTLIVSAWKMGTSDDNKRLEIYNCVSGLKHAINWGYFVQLCRNELKKYPSENRIMYPYFHIMNKEPFFSATSILFNDIPMYFMDLKTFITTGRNPRYSHLLKKYLQALKQMGNNYFIMQEWNFENSKFQNLKHSLNLEDRILFNMDMTKISWNKYLADYVQGIYMLLLRKQVEKSISKKDLDNPRIKSQL